MQTCKASSSVNPVSLELSGNFFPPCGDITAGWISKDTGKRFQRLRFNIYGTKEFFVELGLTVQVLQDTKSFQDTSFRVLSK